jgi:hypothetical protein
MAGMLTGKLRFFLVLAAVGCRTPALPLIDLPELRVVTPPGSPGSPVVLEVINSTPHGVSFEALACDVVLEHLIGGEWRLVEPTGECAGLQVDLPPGGRHPVSVDTPADRGGRFRALIEGSSPDGPFVIRSHPFLVE